MSASLTLMLLRTAMTARDIVFLRIQLAVVSVARDALDAKSALTTRGMNAILRMEAVTALDCVFEELLSQR